MKTQIFLIDGASLLLVKSRSSLHMSRTGYSSMIKFPISRRLLYKYYSSFTSHFSTCASSRTRGGLQPPQLLLPQEIFIHMAPTTKLWRVSLACHWEETIAVKINRFVEVAYPCFISCTYPPYVDINSSNR